jgi:hypothetical protein
MLGASQLLLPCNSSAHKSVLSMRLIFTDLNKKTTSRKGILCIIYPLHVQLKCHSTPLILPSDGSAMVLNAAGLRSMSVAPQPGHWSTTVARTVLPWTGDRSMISMRKQLQGRYLTGRGDRFATNRVQVGIRASSGKALECWDRDGDDEVCSGIKHTARAQSRLVEGSYMR